MSPSNNVGDNFEVACSLLGWGDPGTADSRAIWFIGIEEGTVWTNETIARVRGHKFILASEDPKENVANKPAQWMSKILCGFSANYAGRHWAEAWKHYRDTILWRPESRTAQLNFYPLGRPNQKFWPDSYEAMFRFAGGDREAYKTAVWNRRRPKIEASWSECRPQATICFGIRPDFLRLFKLDPRPGEDRIFVYEEQRIMLIPTLQGQWGHMTHNRVERIIGHLNRWHVDLP